jgi:hypothetical protein
MTVDGGSVIKLKLLKVLRLCDSLTWLVMHCVLTVLSAEYFARKAGAGNEISAIGYCTQRYVSNERTPEA